MNDTTNFHKTLRAAAYAGLAGALSLSIAGCKSKDQAPVITGNDPAAANVAQPYTGGDTGGYANGQTQVLGQSQSSTPGSSSESYESQTPAPIVRHRATASAPAQYYPVPQANSQASYQTPQGSYDQGQGYAQATQQGYAQAPQGNYGGNYDPNAYNGGYGDAEAAGEEALAEADQPPPPLPEYDQPPAPEDDYLWTPGYWNYVNTGYYWVPGAWVAPPFYGALWTPPYWGYERNRYICHHGYWGPHVGYYGGVNYGFGYIGFGYFGGYWQNRNFYYNRAVTNVNINNVHNVYNRTVIYNNVTYGARPDNRISYNGGRGGLNVQPRPQELAAMREAHYAPVAAQRDNRLAAANNRAQFFNANGGRPAQAFAGRPVGNVRAIAATPQVQPFNHPAVFNQPNQPGANNNLRPGIAGQPAGNVARPGFNQPVANNAARPGTVNGPGFNGNRPANANQPGGLNGNRPGAINRPGVVNQPAGNNARPTVPNQGGNGRPGTFNRPGTPSQPAVNNTRPIAPNQVGNGRPGVANRPESTPLPAPANNHGNRPGATNQPAFNNSRPAEVSRPNPTPQPPVQARPNLQAGRPQTAGQVQTPSRFEGQRPAATPAPAPARPQVAAPRPAAPAPAAAPHVEAPRGGGAQPHGGDHPHGR